jgi:16S rRNA G1207 methylase RsmC
VPEHYFTSEPQSNPRVRTINFAFASQEFVVQVDAGVFSATRLDPGTKVLLKHLDSRPADILQDQDEKPPQLLDLGCGWGPISISLASKYPMAQVNAVDINRRALENLQRSAKQLGLGSIKTFEPEVVPSDLEFDEIWSNPPIRIGKEALHSMLQLWLPRLTSMGKAYLVVSKHLGADSLQSWINALPGFQCARLETAKGFRILEVSRSN